MKEKTALVLDDRQTHLDEVRKSLEKEGYSVTGVMSLKDAKAAVLSTKESGRDFDLIVSDFDLGSKIYQKHRWFDGYRFVLWCKQQGIASKVIMCSSAFEPSKRIMAFLHRSVIKSARNRGVIVQGKSALMPSYRAKKHVVK